MKIIVSQVAGNMIPQFIHRDLKDKLVIVKEGEVVDLGDHKLQFFMAPMVHWPEVMVTYEQTEKYYSLQMDLENLEHLMLKMIGIVKQEDITLI